MNKICLSIIVPVYNTSEFLSKCLDSIIKQNFSNIEIIVVNDASTDNSLEIIKEFQEKDSRIIIINKSKNEGLSAARNSGLEISKGEYVLHIDSDDWIEQGYFKSMYEMATINGADVVISDFYLEYECGSIKYVKDQRKNKEVVIDKVKAINSIFKGLGNAYPCVWNKLIKRDLYFTNNILHYPDISLGEDLAVIPRILYHSKKIVKLNKAYIHYYQNSNSITKNITFDRLNQVYTVFQRLEKFFEQEKKISSSKGCIVFLTPHFLNINYEIDDPKYNEVFSFYLKNIEKLNVLEMLSFRKPNIKYIVFILSIKYFPVSNKKIFKFWWFLNKIYLNFKYKK